MDRQLIAYLIIVAMVLGLAGLIAYKVYHSRERSYRRRIRREQVEYQKRLVDIPKHSAGSD
jgi:Tfp pilus assembly protein PilV